ncbi:MAG: cell division ATP-binding protein FtsE [Candidatus Acidulodesulfobacterium ferriphilum]|uniref:Cell division ATP-binding protein FtsE n=1 Tax=Candidatus Acidulodesulfobacterium ferriphilum TaxID=2597223 RepID=A0A519BAT1_9DELT|nr:cell division ATP-binding protein FtsE [Deltaproteobacteria bacterium]MCL5893104.1 cell division ATP-binding protein FtsE [Deltaproteobacteria bacterium]RZD14392.1 MAG: cell division ATP-binding protein FtsE [Candidatus Acidulodesulfobacterium ferriphilum]
MIEFNHVYKSYDKNYILRDLNFNVNKGEFIFITGPSGAGKTTTLKMLIALEKPTHGAIKFMDTELQNIKPKDIPFLRRKIGFVFQDFKLLPNRTVFQNVALGLEVSGIFGDVIVKNVTEILKAVELFIKKDEYPLSLSGGEQQRVAIARALVQNPQVLLADEPTGNLDEDTSKIIIDIIKSFNNKGTTVILATHDKNLIRMGRARTIDITKS